MTVAMLSGLTHADTVAAVERSSKAESGTDTESLTPSKSSALPNFPAADQDAPEIVPTFAALMLLATVVPAPASKPYAAMSPAVLVLPASTTLRLSEVLRPAAS